MPADESNARSTTRGPCAAWTKRAQTLHEDVVHTAAAMERFTLDVQRIVQAALGERHRRLRRATHDALLCGIRQVLHLPEDASYDTVITALQAQAQESETTPVDTAS